MARVTYVKRAQQRYHQKPVIDPATGQQKVTPVISRRTGEQKVSKRGPQFLRVTEDDKSRPKPPETCGKCGKTIEVGMPYKHITPKSGPYGGRRMVRCADCPTWQVWDYSSSLSARTAQISHEGWEALDDALDSATDTSDVESVLTNIAEEIRSLAEEKREGAQNIEDGFGHSTSQSDELNEIADSLDSWADEVEQANVPEIPEPEEEDCGQCDGNGSHEERFWVMNVDGSGNVFEDEPDGFATEEQAQAAVDDLVAQTATKAEDVFIEGREEPCTECDGTGQVTPDEPTEEQMDEWRQEVRDELGVIDECPV